MIFTHLKLEMTVAALVWLCVMKMCRWCARVTIAYVLSLVICLTAESEYQLQLYTLTRVPSDEITTSHQ